MYRVLIVDDEEPVLDAYAFLLESAGADFALVGKARSGYEAIKAMHEVKPDVVFMDINIPGIDGIEVIAQVHDRFPSTVFILSTAYERFDLAQRAIPLGVFAYLVKPVSKKVFLSTLESVRKNLETRPPVFPPHNADFAERQFLFEVIRRELRADEWDNYRDLLSLHSDKGAIFLLELEDEQEKWCKAVAERISFRHRCLFCLNLHRGLFLISEDADSRALSAELEETVRAVVPADLFRAHAVGRTHRGTELYRSYDEAREELRRKQDRAEAELRERMRIVQVRRKIGIVGEDEAAALFTVFWEEIFAFHDFAVAKAKMVAFFTLLIDDLCGCYGALSEVEPPFSPAEEITAVADQAEWVAWSSRAFADLCRSFQTKRSGNFPVPLAKALEFLNERFGDQIQLGDVAEAAQVSTSYLSRLFSEHLQVTFIDYLTELRIGKAESLIRDSRLTIKEIGYAVGYQDPNYFGKIFRKTTGVPPTIYAAEHRGDHA
jgi:two-component system response regulator YesN